MYINNDRPLYYPVAHFSTFVKWHQTFSDLAEIFFCQPFSLSSLAMRLSFFKSSMNILNVLINFVIIIWGGFTSNAGKTFIANLCRTDYPNSISAVEFSFNPFSRRALFSPVLFFICRAMYSLIEIGTN